MPLYAPSPRVATCCPAGCEGITPVSPEVTVTDSGECVSEPRSISAVQSQELDIKWVFVDKRGTPIDLTGCQPSAVRLRTQEAATRQGTVVTATCTVNNQVKGGLLLNIPAASLTKPGVFEMQFGLELPLGNETVLRFMNRGYLIVENSLFAADADQANLGPPLISEVLMAVRMGDPMRSDLLKRREWDLTEIAQALVRPVEHFNDALPPIGQYFDTTDYPFRQAWRDATVAVLMQMAGYGYLRDDAVYAGDTPGAVFNDKAKWQQYLEIANNKWEAYSQFVLAQKVAWNQRNSFGFCGTPYAYLP